MLFASCNKEDSFPFRSEQKLQKQNLLLEARLQLQRDVSGGSSRPQSSQHSHSTNTPRGAVYPSTEGDPRGSVSKPGENGRRHTESAAGKQRASFARAGRGDAAVSSQNGPRGDSPGQSTGRRSARAERPGERERVIEYAGQVKSGGSVAGMYDPKYISRDTVRSERVRKSSRDSASQNGRVQRNGGAESLREDREEHPPWLFADSGASRRSSERSRASESDLVLERVNSLDRSSRRSQGGNSQTGSSRKRVSGNGYSEADKRGVPERNRPSVQSSEARRTSGARKGKSIRTLQGQGSLEDSFSAVYTPPEAESSRVPSAREEIEVLHERIASGNAGPSGRPFSGSLPDEVAQRETDLYQQLYQPLVNSLSLRRRQMGGSFASLDERSSEPSVSLSRTGSSKLEELLTRVERDGLHPLGGAHEATRVSTAAKPAQSLQALDSPQGGLSGERRSRPHEEAPGFKGLGAPFLQVEQRRGLSSAFGGGGLTSFLNGGFLAEGLGASVAGAPRNEEVSGALESAWNKIPFARDGIEGEREAAFRRGGVLKSEVKARGDGDANPTSQNSSRPSSGQLADKRTGSQTGTKQRRPSSAASSRERHVSVPERPASASDAHRPGSRSDPVRNSHVAPSAHGRATSEGQRKLERSASVKSSLSRSGSMGHVAGSGREAGASDGQPRLERSASGRNVGGRLSRSNSKSGNIPDRFSARSGIRCRGRNAFDRTIRCANRGRYRVEAAVRGRTF